MAVVEVGHYDAPDEVGFKRWIGTRDWVIFERNDGTLHVFHGRDPRSGAVLDWANVVTVSPSDKEEQ